MRPSVSLTGAFFGVGFFVLGICVFVGGCSDPFGNATRRENQCTTNMMQTWYSLRRASWNDIKFPPTLEVLSNNIGQADTLVCPVTGHQVGGLSNIEDWTDFVYVGNIDIDAGAPEGRVAMIICPPENHGGKFGHVVWRSGFVERFPSNIMTALIKTPWLMATNIEEREIDALRRTIDIRVPKRLRSYYGNGDSSDKSQTPK